MFNNYLKIALRNLRNHKLYSLINICGLAVGLAACLMISLFVHYEFSYDDFIADADRVYRISPNFEASSLGPARQPAGNVAPLAPLIEQAGIEGVEQVARLGGMHAMIGRDEVAYFEDNLKWVDSAFFEIFPLQWLGGSAATALSEPFTIVISESIARRYFGTEDPMGQTLMLENTWPVTVTGVVQDLPENTHLLADLFVSIDTAWAMLEFDYSNNWAYTNFHTYLKLEPGSGIETVMQDIDSIVTGDKAMIDEEIAGFFSIDAGTFSLTPYKLADIHLFSTRRGEFKPSGSIDQVMMFSAVAFCLLLIACINFMNLSTARATQRAREVGTRKAVGADRRSIGRQFLGESLLLTSLALLIALALAQLLLPVFAGVVERQLDFAGLFTPAALLFILALTLTTALVAGSYPAFYLSSFNPVHALKQGLPGLKGTLGVRNVLVVLQFFLAITLIVATVVIALQLQYVRDRELGFNKDNILTLSGTHQEGMGARWEVFKERVLQYPQVLNVAEEALWPGSAGSRHVRIEGGTPGGFDVRAKPVGFGFFDTYDIDLLAGRDFNEEISSDRFVPPANVAPGEQPAGSFILNETAVRELGLTPEEVLGRHFEVDFSSDFSLTVAGPVIGVAEDIHLFSLRETIEPLVYYVPTAMWGDSPSFVTASIRVAGENMEAALELIRETWESTITDVPFMPQFLDTQYELLYRDEARQGKLFTLFAVLTVIIACLGLFGLASFAVERRRKEIGVRKVMGSSVWRIVTLLTADFSKLVLIANVVAWPVAYVAMQRWLENFAYRIDLTPLVFIGSGLIALCVAWATVGGTAAKAASQKPVLALRYE